MTLMLLIALSGVIASCGFMLIGCLKEIENIKKDILCLEKIIESFKEATNE